jgi:hypothetical protein
MLDEFYEFDELPDRLGDGLQGMFERLAARGVRIVSREPGCFAGISTAGRPGCSVR